MATPANPVVSAFDLTKVFKTLYTVTDPNVRASIDAAVFNNYSGTNVTFTVRLVQSGTSTVLNEVITAKRIRKGENDLAPGIIGQGLLKGGKIEAKASANSSVNVAITVTEIQ